MEKTRKEELYEAIENFPLVGDTPNLMAHVIPRGKSVIIKERPDLQSSHQTQSGIQIVTTQDSSTMARIGVICAIGPDVDADLEIGQLVYFNQFANLQVLIEGNLYFKMTDMDIYFHVNPEGKSTYVGQGKTVEEIRRDEGLKQTIKMVENFHQEIAEIPDRIKTEKKKGSRIFMPTKGEA